jgi:hypothetical protein
MFQNVILFFILLIMTRAGLLQTARALEKEIGVKAKYYPRHYVVPCSYIRKRFHLGKKRLLWFSYLCYLLSEVSFILFAIELWASLTRTNGPLVDVLFVIHIGLSVILSISAVIVCFFYRGDQR